MRDEDQMHEAMKRHPAGSRQRVVDELESRDVEHATEVGAACANGRQALDVALAYLTAGHGADPEIQEHARALSLAVLTGYVGEHEVDVDLTPRLRPLPTDPGEIA